MNDFDISIKDYYASYNHGMKIGMKIFKDLIPYVIISLLYDNVVAMSVLNSFGKSYIVKGREKILEFLEKFFPDYETIHTDPMDDVFPLKTYQLLNILEPIERIKKYIESEEFINARIKSIDSYLQSIYEKIIKEITFKANNPSEIYILSNKKRYEVVLPGDYRSLPYDVFKVLPFMWRKGYNLDFTVTALRQILPSMTGFQSKDNYIIIDNTLFAFDESIRMYKQIDAYYIQNRRIKYNGNIDMFLAELNYYGSLIHLSASFVNGSININHIIEKEKYYV